MIKRPHTAPRWYSLHHTAPSRSHIPITGLYYNVNIATTPRSTLNPTRDSLDQPIVQPTHVSRRFTGGLVGSDPV